MLVAVAAVSGNANILHYTIPQQNIGKNFRFVDRVRSTRKLFCLIVSNARHLFLSILLVVELMDFIVFEQNNEIVNSFFVCMSVCVCGFTFCGLLPISIACAM